MNPDQGPQESRLTKIPAAYYACQQVARQFLAPAKPWEPRWWSLADIGLHTDCPRGPEEALLIIGPDSQQVIHVTDQPSCFTREIERHGCRVIGVVSRDQWMVEAPRTPEGIEDV